MLLEKTLIEPAWFDQPVWAWSAYRHNQVGRAACIHPLGSRGWLCRLPDSKVGLITEIVAHPLPSRWVSINKPASEFRRRYVALLVATEDAISESGDDVICAIAEHGR